jgi:hypothetical protein
MVRRDIKDRIGVIIQLIGGNSDKIKNNIKREMMIVMQNGMMRL